MPSYVRAGIRKCARIRALSVGSPSKLEELLNLIHRTVSVSTETTIVLQRYFAK